MPEIEKKFYDSRGGSRGESVYAELLLTDSEPASQHLKALRHQHVAILSCRMTSANMSEDEIQRHEDASALLVVMEAYRTEKPLRYDKVTILRRPASEEIELTIEFIRKWFPRALEERRLFVTTIDMGIPEITIDDYDKALGAAEVVT